MVGRCVVWLGEPIRNGLPRLYADGNAALLCDGRWAFQLTGLFSSMWQMRLWCAFHGFELRDADWQPRPTTMGVHGRPLRLRPLGDFNVRRYAQHVARCPDCQRSMGRGQWAIAERSAPPALRANGSGEASEVLPCPVTLRYPNDGQRITLKAIGVRTVQVSLRVAGSRPPCPRQGIQKAVGQGGRREAPAPSPCFF